MIKLRYFTLSLLLFVFFGFEINSLKEENNFSYNNSKISYINNSDNIKELNWTMIDTTSITFHIVYENIDGVGTNNSILWELYEKTNNQTQLVRSEVENFEEWNAIECNYFFEINDLNPSTDYEVKVKAESNVEKKLSWTTKDATSLEVKINAVSVINDNSALQLGYYYNPGNPRKENVILEIYNKTQDKVGIYNQPLDTGGNIIILDSSTVPGIRFDLGDNFEIVLYTTNAFEGKNDKSKYFEITIPAPPELKVDVVDNEYDSIVIEYDYLRGIATTNEQFIINIKNETTKEEAIYGQYLNDGYNTIVLDSSTVSGVSFNVFDDFTVSFKITTDEGFEINQNLTSIIQPLENPASKNSWFNDWLIWTTVGTSSVIVIGLTVWGLYYFFKRK